MQIALVSELWNSKTELRCNFVNTIADCWYAEQSVFRKLGAERFVNLYDWKSELPLFEEETCRESGKAHMHDGCAAVELSQYA